MQQDSRQGRQDDPVPTVMASEDPRLEALEKRLEHAGNVEAVRSGRGGRSGNRGYSQGNRVLATMIGSLAGCTFLGWLADWLLGTRPWGLLGMLLVGILIALWAVVRIAHERPE